MSFNVIMTVKFLLRFSFHCGGKTNKNLVHLTDARRACITVTENFLLDFKIDFPNQIKRMHLLHGFTWSAVICKLIEKSAEIFQFQMLQ